MRVQPRSRSSSPTRPRTTFCAGRCELLNKYARVLVLLMACTTQELETLAAENPNFKARAGACGAHRALLADTANPQLYYTLDRPPKKWAYGSGFISADMVCTAASKVRRPY